MKPYLINYFYRPAKVEVIEKTGNPYLLVYYNEISLFIGTFSCNNHIYSTFENIYLLNTHTLSRVNRYSPLDPTLFSIQKSTTGKKIKAKEERFL